MSPAYQGYQLLHITFRQILHLLANWEMYLSLFVRRISPLSAHNLMLLVGAVEMAAGLLVAIKPRIGAAVVASWLFLIVVNLVSAGTFLDVALRDFALMLTACALWRLSLDYDR